MKQFTFEPGVHLRIGEQRFTIASPTADRAGFTLVDQVTGLAIERTYDDLLELWSKDVLEYVPPLTFDNKGHIKAVRPSEALATMPARDRARVDLRRAALDAVAGLPERERFKLVTLPHPATGIDVKRPAAWHAVAAVCHAAGRKPVAQSTCYEWAKAFREHGDVADLRGRFHLRGHASPLAEDVRQQMRELVAAKGALAAAQAKAGVYERLTPGNIRGELVKAIAPAKAPSLKTVARAIAQLPAYQRSLIEKGRRRTENDYRMATSLERPEICLDRVEYDETKMRLVVVDELFGVTLGIPYLSWCVDNVCQAPLGFYVGFEPSSDVSTMAALRHACLPKTYIRSTYPSIRGKLLAGIPRGLVLDNGMSQHGDTIHETSQDIGFDYMFAPPYTPWFKGAVENMHRLLTELLLDELPGYIVPQAQGFDEYDPRTHACIGFRHLLFLLHVWIADTYLVTPTGPFGERPIDLWNRDVEISPPRFLACSRDLDLVFGILRRGTLDHRGVRFANLRYLSDDMADFRRMHGVSVPVDVRVNPSNIGHIHWRGPDGLWRRAKARRFDYANARSLHQHGIIVDAARRWHGTDAEEALVAAAAELVKLTKGSAAMANGLRQNAKLARAFGYGTENLLGNHDASGMLGNPTGPFTGMSLDPLGGSELERLPASPSPADALPERVEPPDVASVCAPPARKRFAVQRF